MRTLCLSLNSNQEASCAEVFLELSPRVQFRYPHFVFIDIESTAHLLGGEFRTLQRCLELARGLSPAPTAGIADQPYLAQVISTHRPMDIIESDQQKTFLKTLAIDTCKDMEGLSIWSQPKHVQYIIQFFQSIGLYGIEDVLNFPLASFRERWGNIGVTLWDRLHLKETQPISPLLSHDPLISYGHFDDPVEMVPLLLQKLVPNLNQLFLRLSGRGRFARRLDLLLHCEYSLAEKSPHHSISVEPVTPSRDAQLFIDLLTHKLENISLENPVREFELIVMDVSEKIQQLDFFEPRDTTKDRWQRLISFSQQAQVEVGFLEQKPSHFPENTYHLKKNWPDSFAAKDFVQSVDGSVQVKSMYAKGLSHSPRPSLLLSKPLVLSKDFMANLRFLSPIPTERIESSWWELFRENFQGHWRRDYFIGLSQDGQLLWIYQDRDNNSHYLQGYFD